MKHTHYFLFKKDSLLRPDTVYTGIHIHWNTRTLEYMYNGIHVHMFWRTLLPPPSYSLRRAICPENMEIIWGKDSIRNWINSPFAVLVPLVGMVGVGGIGVTEK